MKVVVQPGSELVVVWACRSGKNQTGMLGEFLVHEAGAWRWVDVAHCVPADAAAPSAPSADVGRVRLAVRLLAAQFRSISMAEFARRAEAAEGVVGILLDEGVPLDDVLAGAMPMARDGDWHDAVTTLVGACLARKHASPVQFRMMPPTAVHQAMIWRDGVPFGTVDEHGNLVPPGPPENPGGRP